MPRFPKLSSRTALVTGSVFEKFQPQLRGKDFVKLHIGDGSEPPPYTLPIDAGFLREHPYSFQYCNTYGVAALREVLVEKLREDNSLPVGDEDVMLTSGACNALSHGTLALVEPGEEVLVLTPAWPFFQGMVRLAGGEVVEVPVYARLYGEPSLDLAAALRSRLTDRTVAIYVNTPNNPSGKVLSREQLSTIAAFAREHDLWVISDEAYDGITFDGLEHVSLGSLSDMFERTLSIFTFSKAFLFAGLRLGYVAAPREVLSGLNKLMIHQLYGPNTLGQNMMIEPVRTRHEWMPKLCARMQALRDELLSTLSFEVPRPEGTYFVFFDAAPLLRGRDFWATVEACLAAGVSVAPGGDFGSDFERHLRLCFTADTPERVLEGAHKLNAILG
jgi:N-succinyldiaminopimelate aminotransferase